MTRPARHSASKRRPLKNRRADAVLFLTRCREKPTRDEFAARFRDLPAKVVDELWARVG